jgi:hypothetical protein
MRHGSYHIGQSRQVCAVPSTRDGGRAIRLPLMTGESPPAAPVWSLIGHRVHRVARPDCRSTPANSSRNTPRAVRSIRAASVALFEGVLVIAVFMTIILAVLAAKLAMWTPFFHR